MEDNYIIIECPHCYQTIFIYKHELNCHIFRCGVYKNTGENIHPHLDQLSCENLFQSGTVYGCCKPFIINNENKAEICDYI